MINNLDELPRLGVFAVVLEAGSFSEAARRLGTSRSAVSRQIALLEERLGVQLLVRTTRSQRPTEAGLQVAQHAQAALRAAELAMAAAQGQREAPRGVLRITAPIGPGQTWLAPRLAGFLRQHPAVEAVVDLNDERVDIVQERYDLALRAGALRDSTLVARKLAELELIVVGPPGSRVLSDPRGLAEAPWVHFSPVPLELDLGTPARPLRVRPRPVARVNDGAVVLQLVLGGLGLAALPRFYIEADLAQGRLVEVLPGRSVRAGALYAVFPPGIVPTSVRALVDHLVATA